MDHPAARDVHPVTFTHAAKGEVTRGGEGRLRVENTKTGSGGRKGEEIRTAGTFGIVYVMTILGGIMVCFLFFISFSRLGSFHAATLTS